MKQACLLSRAGFNTLTRVRLNKQYFFSLLVVFVSSFVAVLLVSSLPLELNRFELNFLLCSFQPSGTDLLGFFVGKILSSKKISASAFRKRFLPRNFLSNYTFGSSYSKAPRITPWGSETLVAELGTGATREMGLCANHIFIRSFLGDVGTCVFTVMSDV